MNRFLALLRKAVPAPAPAATEPPETVAGSGVSQNTNAPATAASEPPETVAGNGVSQNTIAPAATPSGIQLRARRQASFLRRAPMDFPLEERQLRDEKVAFVREVHSVSRAGRIPEVAACAEVAATMAAHFPRLAEGGKNGASMLTYKNYRNWLNGTGGKPGLGRLADGSPDCANADVLLRNYGRDTSLYGDPAFWESFKAHYLQPSAQKMAKIYRILEAKWRLEYPGQPIPALYQVRDYIRKAWPKRFIAYMRKGETYYLQHSRDFVERDPSTVRPNEAWVADSQDCDFMIRVLDEAGQWVPVRPKICVIMDIASEHVVSIQLVSRNDNGRVAVTSEIVRNAFAMGVWYYGRPRVFLTDNGADYCKEGFTTPVTFTPSVSRTKMYSHSIMLELDVMHLTAQPYNARAKFVERFFREMAEYSRAARGYVGNSPAEKPASAKVWAKPVNVQHLMSEEEACRFLGGMVAIYHAEKSPNSKFLRGMSPDEAFAPERRYKRPALTLEEYMRAFLLPLPEARVLESRGPSVRVGGRRFTVVPAGRDRAWHYDGKPVMVKTDLLNDDHLFLFDLDGTYIAEARAPEMMPYFARLQSEEDEQRLAERLQQIRAEKKYLDTMAMDATGGWHRLDPWRLYQMPREAFLGPARLALLDTMYSVKGETHNPRLYVLPEELRHQNIAETAAPRLRPAPAAPAQGITRGVSQNTDTPDDRTLERRLKVQDAIHGALLNERKEDTPNHPRRMLDENFI